MEPIKIPTVDHSSTVEDENKTTNVENDLNAQYVDKRSVTISPVHNYSAYRAINRRALGARKNIIGSSVTSCQILSSNREEVEAYFPQLIGLSPNNPDFISRVKAYLSNIQFNVSDNDTTLDTTFIYNKKSDYLKIKAQEDKINDTYDKVNRADLSAIKDAIRVYVNDMNALESTKHKYGRPNNLQEYLMYRHCLLYKDVAKDIALINSDSSLRFYIKNEAREAEKQKKIIIQKKAAMRNFIELNGSDSKRNAVYINMVVSNNGNVFEALLKSKEEQESALMDFVNTSPDKFNKLFEDKHSLTKSFIETLIARGELIRAEFNQQISSADGTFIGSNINEAVAYFENPANKDVREAYENKLKLF